MTAGNIAKNIFERVYNEAKRIKKTSVGAFDFQRKKILRENIQFKNRFEAKRCFIIGNGPSLKKQDLSHLKDEIVFTVNYMYKSPLYKEVCADFHVMVDPFIFEFDLEKDADREKLESFKMIVNNKVAPVCFFPYDKKEDIEKVVLSDFLNISYLDCTGNIYEGFNKKIDMTRTMFGYCNVVQYAISIAVYMGFSEIYLLGCDMTGYEQISVMAGKEVELHAYKMSEQEKEQIKKTHSKINPETFFEGFYRMFADYRRLYEYTKKRNIKLYNATAGGVLDCIPRVDYNTLFMNKEKSDVKQ